MMPRSKRLKLAGTDRSKGSGVMIQALLFDLFETLVTESSASVRRASSLARQLGVEEGAYRKLWRSRRLDIVRGRCSFRDTLAEIVQTLGGTVEEAVLEGLRSERVRQKGAVLRSIEPEVLAVLEALRARRLKLAVVSRSGAGCHGCVGIPAYVHIAETGV